jgi:hypothetical protein
VSCKNQGKKRLFYPDFYFFKKNLKKIKKTLEKVWRIGATARTFAPAKRDNNIS